MLNKSVVLTIAATMFAAIFAFSLLWMLSRESKSPSGSGTQPRAAATVQTPPSTPVSADHGQSEDALPKAADADQVYRTRARVDALPSADGKFSLMLHHEEIKDFVGKNGSVVGMKEMIMPFPDVASGVDISGLKEGDLIEVVFEVRWNKPPRTLLTRIRPLPADTVLDLSKVIEDSR